jgi:hypothetical protein
MKDDIRIYLKELSWKGRQGIDWIPVASGSSQSSALCGNSKEISNVFKDEEFLFLTEWLPAITARSYFLQLCAVSKHLSEI